MHPDPFDCPDALIYYDAKVDRYGIIVHDGGQSYVVIRVCPWCGGKLPKDKVKERLKRLAEIGIKDPDREAIPKEFETDAWYRGKSALHRKGTPKRRRNPRNR
jgi:hypothetical protein